MALFLTAHCFLKKRDTVLDSRIGYTSLSETKIENSRILLLIFQMITLNLKRLPTLGNHDKTR